MLTLAVAGPGTETFGLPRELLEDPLAYKSPLLNPVDLKKYCRNCQRRKSKTGEIVAIWGIHNKLKRLPGYHRTP
ncbi:hypothetical protein, partial [Streptomyces turgidiscabies]|uniref:hypothetical protein n=1 Tax=Streptomyces turgidiscabies TaxID=85558 RepID=UPI0038F6A155